MVGKLGVSRTGVRAALQSLESEGLVVRGRAAYSRWPRSRVKRRARSMRSAPRWNRPWRAPSSSVRQKNRCPLWARLWIAPKRPRVQRTGLPMLMRFAASTRRCWPEAATTLPAEFSRLLEARITYLRHVTTERAPQPRQLRTVALLRGIFSAVRKREQDVAARRCAAFVTRSARFALDVLQDSACSRRIYSAATGWPSAAKAARTAGITSVPKRRTLSRATACGRPDQEVLKMTLEMPVSR